MTDTLDLRGVLCPMNYVKAKLALEPLAPGDLLEILLDAGEPMANVPRSLTDDGHRTLSAEQREGHFVVTVEKGGDRAG